MNFNSEKNGYKNSSAHELLSKKYATFLQFMAKNDVIFLNQLKRLMSFSAMKRKKVYIFSLKVCAHSSSYNHFFQNWNS